MDSVSILGIKVSVLKKSEAIQVARDFLFSQKQNYIFTPNPEMIVDASHDSNFKQALNQGDLNLCDGFGLALFTRAPRITGVDFMLELCSIAEQEKKSIYLLGSGNTDTLRQTSEFLLNKFPNLNIVGADPGYQINLKRTEQGTELDYNATERDETVHKIIMSAPDILVVAFGHNKQEQWIVQNAPNLPSLKIAMGVGGAFDFLSGKIPRAPRSIRLIGLEWLWRLVLEPSRLGRILKAVAVFPILVVWSKLKA